MPATKLEPRFDVFISYRRGAADALALLLQTQLQKHGIAAFFDRDLRRGVFDEMLLRRIAESPTFLIILTPGALDRCTDEEDWLRKEIVQAIETRRNVVPLQVDAFQFTSEVVKSLDPAIRGLSRYQAVVYSRDYFENTVERIVSIVVEDKAERKAEEEQDQEQVRDSADKGLGPPDRSAVDIFISYTSKDRHRVRPLVDTLRECGWRVWWDQDMRTGAKIDEAVDENLKRARAVVGVLSSNFPKSDWCFYEIDEASKRNVLFPVLIDDIEPPFWLSHLHTTKLAGWSESSSSPLFQKLRNDLAAVLGFPEKSAENVWAFTTRTFKSGQGQSKTQSEHEDRRLRVFLCHSSRDKEPVRKLYHRLKQDGFAPWLDEEDLIPGQDWQQEIPNAVRTCHVVVVCLSLASINKEGFVQKEIKLALDAADEKPDGTIFVIPARLEEIEVPIRLARWHWVNLFQKSGYDKLVKALQTRATAGPW